MTEGHSHRFAVDRNLGKLAKWLRLVGFDTEFEPANTINDKFWKKCDFDRILLVRSRQLMRILASNTPLLIIPNDPFEQFQQVIQTFEIKIEDLTPFTRCTICNLPLEIAEKKDIFGLIPDYVWQTQQKFRRCSGCRRIYWAGSHKKRGLRRIHNLMKNTFSPDN